MRTALVSSFGAFQPYHLPSSWNPHCTIAYSLNDSDLQTALEICRKSDVFGKAKLVEIVIVGSKGKEISFKLGKNKQ